MCTDIVVRGMQHTICPMWLPVGAIATVDFQTARGKLWKKKLANPMCREPVTAVMREGARAAALSRICGSKAHYDLVDPMYSRLPSPAADIFVVVVVLVCRPGWYARIDVLPTRADRARDVGMCFMPWPVVLSLAKSTPPPR